MQVRCTQVDHRNQQIIGVCIDITCQNQRPYCNFCLPLHAKHLQMLTPLDLLNEWIQKRIISVNNVYNNAQELKGSLDSLINQFYTYLNFHIDQLPELGLLQIDILTKGLCQIEDCENVLFEQLKQAIEQGNSIVREILKSTKNQTNFKENDNTLILDHIDQMIEDQSRPLNNLKPINFQLMNYNSIKQGNDCRAVAFNKDCSLVAAGCDNLITIYEFGKGKLKQMQLLNEHNYRVTTLNFMKNSNQLISGDYIGTILVWSGNDNTQWICSQELNKHNCRINCLIMNNDEDTIITSSEDKTIKFWIKQKEWICQQTITDHQHYVFQLSLNEKQNIVISCGWDQLILVIEYSQQKKQWIVIQNIQVDLQGRRLCFINNNLFTFQPYKGNLMYVYKNNGECKQFIKIKDIAVDLGNDGYAFFPQQYIKQKQLLVSKHQNINLIRKIDNFEFKVEQCIKFGSQYLFGQMSDDGEYLITWDNSSKEIQIRRCIQE